MRPILGKTKWWEKKAKENLETKKHYKNWCVIKRIKSAQHDVNKWEPDYYYEYLAVARSNAPEYYHVTGKLKKSTHVDNLTQAEAVAMAKMLNFVGEIDE